MRQEEERIRERKEILMKKLTMLNEQRKARHSIPKAPPPPPVVELDQDEEAFRWQDNGELENIVLDTGMHTVKVGEVSCINDEISLLCSL